MPKASSCLRSQVPRIRPVVFSGPHDGCPKPWGVCLDHDSAANLVGNLEQYERFVRNVLTECGDFAPAPLSVIPEKGTP